jgi:1,4-dihydroxy-2-naphthoyl-CoA synthase
MVELILLTIGSFFAGYLVSYLAMTVGVKQDK